MKKLLLLILAAAFMLAGCDEHKNNSSNTINKEAEEIAERSNNQEELKKYIDHFNSTGDKRASLIIRQKYGKVLRNCSNFETAVKQHDSCIIIARELNDTAQLIAALNNQGTNFRRLRDLEGASRFHFEALKLTEEMLNDTSYATKRNRLTTLNGLGSILLAMKNYEPAEEAFRIAYNGEQELDNSEGMVLNLTNIGSIKEQIGQLDSARIYYKWAMEQSIISNNRIGVAIGYQNFGNLDLKNGENDKAMENYRKSYTIGKTTSDIYHWLESCEALAELFLEENRLDSAAKYIEIGLEASSKINSSEQKANFYSYSSRLHSITGDYKQALTEYHMSQSLKESIIEKENLISLQNQRVKYEEEKRSKELSDAKDKANAERTTRTIIMWAGIVVVILTITTIILQTRVMKERKRNNEILKKTDKERQEFYRGVTHQLRTPLTVVTGMFKQIKKYIPQDDSEAVSLYDAIDRQSSQLVTLVAEMIEYAKLGKVRPIINELPKNTNPSAVTATLYDSTDDNKQSKTYKILIAEDDPDIALLITSMLKDAGYSYHWTKDGQEAFDTLNDYVPSLLITDIMMPRMDGIELMKKIREDDNLSHLPIIVVSARVENEDRLAGIKAGAEVYLAKPFVPEELLLRVDKLIEQRMLLKKKFGVQIAAADKQDSTETEISMKENQTNEPDCKFIETVDKAIRENITNSELNATMLADILYLSIPTLNRRIKSIANVDTTHYIRLRRLSRAKHLLLNSNMSMGEIQAVCGFDSPSYFSRAFKAEFGVTPSEFKKDGNNNEQAV